MKACRSHYIGEDFLIDILKNEVLSVFSNKALGEKAAGLLRQELQAVKGTAGRLEKVSAQLTGKYRQQELLYRDRLEGRISLQLFERMNADIEDRINSLKRELAGCEAEKGNEADPFELIRSTAAEIREGGLTKDIISMLVERITVYDDKDFGKLTEQGFFTGAVDTSHPCKPSFEGSGTHSAVVVDFRISNPNMGQPQAEG